MNTPDSKNFIIGVLSTTASVLLVGLLLLQGQARTARAEGMTTAGGNYVLTVGRLNGGDEELLYLIDTGSDKLIAYRFDAVRKTIEVVQGIDLGEIRRASTPPGTAAPPGNTPGQRPPRNQP
jgi:hypothetical protein